jgi:hypothetical protein
MSVRTIEQKMDSSSVWSGTTPPGGIERNITPNAADSVAVATRTWVWTNGDFTDADVGKSFIVANAVNPNNNGHFIIESVTDPQTIVSIEAPGGNETFSSGTVTCEVYEASQTPTLADDIEAFAESFHGGLFDFGQNKPTLVSQIFIKPGTGTTSWSLSLVDKDGVEAVVASASNSNPYLATVRNGESASGLILLEGQKLKLTSVGGPTTASRARITVSSQVE